MNIETSLDHCLAFIDCQLQTPKAAPITGALTRPPTITISRQTGAGGVHVGMKLAAYLQQEAPATGRPWTVFDRNLVQKVLEDHHLPQRIAQYMPEARQSELQNMLEEMLGLHPDAWSLVRQSAETILQLAELGNVILVGRAANIITSRLRNVLHVRLIAPLEQRVQVVMQYHQLSEVAARRFLEEQDHGRRGYVKKFFGRDIDEPLQYHLVVNTGWMSFDETAQLIGHAVLAQFYQHEAAGVGWVRG